MTRTTRIGALLVALALTGATPALAVQAKAKPSAPPGKPTATAKPTPHSTTAPGQTKRLEVTIVGTVASIVDSRTVTVKVNNASPSKANKALAKALRNATITVTTDTKTVIRKGNAAATLASALVGDKVSLKAKCTTVAPFTCLASRINAATPTPKATPTPTPSNSPSA